MKELLDIGFNQLAGVELLKFNCELNKLNGIYTINKSIFELNNSDFIQKPDSIILNNVLEHIADLHSAIKIISSIINPNGLLFIDVPDLENFSEQSNYPFQEISMEHINYFSIDTLELLMRLYGFKLKYFKKQKYKYNYKLQAVFYKQEYITNKLDKYITQCESFLSKTIQVINDYCKSQKPIILWGSGTFCQYLLENTNLSKCNILCIVDKNSHYHGYIINNLYIQSPSILLNNKYLLADIFTITYFFNDEIEETIRDMGLLNKIICSPVNN